MEEKGVDGLLRCISIALLLLQLFNLQPLITCVFKFDFSSWPFLCLFCSWRYIRIMWANLSFLGNSEKYSWCWGKVNLVVWINHGCRLFLSFLCLFFIQAFPSYLFCSLWSKTDCLNLIWFFSTVIFSFSIRIKRCKFDLTSLQLSLQFVCSFLDQKNSI